MDATSALLAVAALGVNFGWQPDERDPQAYEVVVQIEPQLLDALADGHATPIDAHIPAEIAPVRKVRILVGTGDVPRTPLATAAARDSRVAAYAPDDGEATESSSSTRPPLVVRGQAPDWSGDRYQNSTEPNTRLIDRLGPAIGDKSIRTAQAPPPLSSRSVPDRFRGAVVETGDTLRSGIEAGIQQAGEQLGRAGERAVEGASDVGRGVGKQFKNLTGADNTPKSPTWAPPPLRTDSAASSNTKPPGLARGGLAVGLPTWTSIKPDHAPPRLKIPAMQSAKSRVEDGAKTAIGSGPSLPPLRSDPPPFRNLTADASAASQPLASPPRVPAAQPNWSEGWGDSPNAAANPQEKPSVGADTSAATTKAPVAWPPLGEPVAGAPLLTTPPAKPTISPADTDNRYSLPVTPLPGAPNNRAESKRDPVAASSAPAQPTAPARGPATDFAAGLPAVNLPEVTIKESPSAEAERNAVAASPPAARGANPTIGYAPSTTARPTAADSAADLPWLPLLGVSVGLVASLAANIFLGWSYADARQRYRSLARKTTRAYQESAGVAA